VHAGLPGPGSVLCVAVSGAGRAPLGVTRACPKSNYPGEGTPYNPRPRADPKDTA
jgi:hypothetical protein